MDAPAGFKPATRDDLVVGRRFCLVPVNGGIVRRGVITGVGERYITTVESGSAMFTTPIDQFLSPVVSEVDVFIEGTYPTAARRVGYVYERFNTDGGQEYALDNKNVEDVLAPVGRIANAYCTYFRYEAEVKESNRTVLMRSEPINISGDVRLR